MKNFYDTLNKFLKTRILIFSRLNIFIDHHRPIYLVNVTFRSNNYYCRIIYLMMLSKMVRNKTEKDEDS